ncbi:hypothetical protein NG895_05275 [Aeoliella sp. ICT_H6.2]|uniref:Uncharacterized protein n=1 Tax=Aeoliella straminimaris TaxID=2954799 RepID=A0A9X2FC88_9BACT|nr:hypothetical protein [Aeoliella straminimaris]MCO6043311.1 hypothetical protein [Aeoliella straminimaris]
MNEESFETAEERVDALVEEIIHAVKPKFDEVYITGTGAISCSILGQGGSPRIWMSFSRCRPPLADKLHLQFIVERLAAHSGHSVDEIVSAIQLPQTEMKLRYRDKEGIIDGFITSMNDIAALLQLFPDRAPLSSP